MGEVSVPVFHDVAIAENPALLAFEHIVTDRPPCAVINLLFIRGESHTKEVFDQVVALLVQLDPCQCELVGPLDLIVVVLEVTTGLELRTDLNQ